MIVGAGGKVGELILALRDATPAMDKALISETEKQLELEDHPQSAELARIDAYRTAVADYAVLLGRLNYAWQQLVAAAERPSNQASLASLAQTSASIVADAGTVRQSLAVLRRGGTGNE